MKDAAFYFAQFSAETSYEDLPEKVVLKIKNILSDALACILAGANNPNTVRAGRLFCEMGGKAEAGAFAAKRKLPAMNAALVNAVAGTCLDYNDLNEPAHTHIGISCVPAALAVAESLGTRVCGKDIICSLAVGMEIGCRLGLAAIKRYEKHVMGGWVYCSVHASISSAVVASKLMGLSAQETRNAIGIAYHQAAGNGLAAFDGTDVRVFGAGFAARNGILAAMLAQIGVTGTQNSIDSDELSLMNLYHNGAKAGVLLEKLGSDYHLLDTGFKAYPCCGLGHRQLDAVSEVIKENSIAAENIIEIKLSVPLLVYKQLVHSDKPVPPSNMSQAQFDLRWQTACMALYGKLGLSEFQASRLAEPDILEMMKKVHIEAEETLSDETIPAEVSIESTLGIFCKKTEDRYGSPQKPFSADRLREKMLECAGYGQQLTKEDALELCECISVLEYPDAAARMFKLLG